MTLPFNLGKFSREGARGRLLVVAALFLIAYSLALTLSPVVRQRMFSAGFLWGHWLALAAWASGMTLVYRQMRVWAPNSDPYLFAAAALLSGWGLLTIWRLTSDFGLRQTLWLVVSLTVFIAGLRFGQNLAFLRRYKYLWLTGGLALTALTLFFGTNPLGFGPRLWLGCCGVYLQPSEPLKLLLIIYLAAYLADRQPLIPGLALLLAPTMFMAGLALLLLLVQRDLGTATIFVFIYTAVIYTATGRRRILLISLATLALAAVLGYQLFDVVRLRFDAWLNPWVDPSGRSYQIVQSVLAIASGGMFGRGPGLGSPGVVPINHSDFIYSSIVEETGLVGAFGLLAMLALLAVKGLSSALRARDSYHRYLGIGIAAYLGGQSILIIGGTIRLLPLTGVTLPFVSYGGSSLLTSFIALLILTHISNQGTESNRKDGSQAALQLAGFLLAGFFAAGIATSWWSFFRGPDLLTRTDNPRRAVSDLVVPRGALLDREGEIINETIGEPGAYQRVYRQPSLSNVVGYTHPIYGQAGLEASLDEILRGDAFNSAWGIWRDHLLYGQPPPGNDIQLSLDLELQTLAEDLLDDRQGAAVLLNAQTGEILALASAPTFDANILDEAWSALVEDEEGPLVNRATLGSYQPGRSLGPFLLAATLAVDDLALPPQSPGFQTPTQTLACAETPDSADSWGAAIAAGCPGPSAELGLLLDGQRLTQLFAALRFYEEPLLYMPVAEATTQTPIITPQESGIGAAQLRLSPLQLALAAAALSNGGQAPAPHIAVAVEGGSDIWLPLEPLSAPQMALPEADANQAAMLLADETLPIWETVALALGNPEEPLTWYLAGTLPDFEGESYALAILLEENNPGAAKSIGRQMLEAVLGL